MSQPTALRPLGAFERFCATRHHLGLYRCVGMTCRYRLPSDLIDLDSAIVTALTAVVKDQPLLQVGVLGDDTNEPAFSHIPEIDLRNHIEYRDAEAETQNEYDAEIANMAARAHDQLFTDVATQPPWNIKVVKPKKGVFPEACVDIFFAFHHSIMDGTGGREFHQHLIAALRTTTAQNSPPTRVAFPNAPEMPESQEDAVGFKNSYRFLGAAIWTMLRPNFLKPSPGWAGKPISLEHPHVTRALPIDFSAEVLASLIKGARAHSTTLTGLLHSFILTSFSTRLSANDVKSLQCTTPINCRPYMLPTASQASKTKLCAAVTTLAIDHSPAIVSELRNNPSDELIWSSARRIKEQLVAHVSKLPNDTISGLTPMISDMSDFFRKKEGTEREALWELSNIGVLKQDKAAEGEWKVTRLSFTSSPMVAGPALAFNTASAEGLTVTISWQKGIVEDELIEGAKGDLLRWAKRWHEEGKFL